MNIDTDNLFVDASKEIDQLRINMVIKCPSPDAVNLIGEEEYQPESNNSSTSTPHLLKKHCRIAIFKVKFKLE